LTEGVYTELEKKIRYDRMTIMKKLSIYIRALRLPFITASLIPALCSLVLSYDTNSLIIPGLFSVIGVAFLHLGANVLNDYYDTGGSDSINRYYGPFSGGSRVVIEGMMSKKEILTLSIICFAIGIIFGVSTLFYKRIFIIPIGAIGLLLGVLYSASPFSLMSRGLGEIAIFFAFGPVLTLGVGYSTTGVLSIEHFLYGFPFGFFVSGILYINEFPDIEADRNSGKWNIVVRLGYEKALLGYPLLIIFGFLSIFLLSIKGIYPVWCLFSFLALPLGFKATRILFKNYSQPKALIPAQSSTIQLNTLSGIIILIISIFRRLL